MSRLFTFGCSYTGYMWPTWADIYASNFDHYQNWGFPGAGNRYIFEALMECDTTNNFIEDDTVIVMWSNHQRYDRYDDEARWCSVGNIYNSSGAYSDEWIQKYFSLKGHILHSLNFIHASQEFLNGRNINWYMSSMSDLELIISETWSPIKFFMSLWRKNKYIDSNIFEKYPELEKYKPMLKKYGHRWKENMDDFTKNRYNKSDFRIDDMHPTPVMHHEWVKTQFGFQLPAEKLKYLIEIDDLIRHKAVTRDDVPDILDIDEDIFDIFNHTRVYNNRF